MFKCYFFTNLLITLFKGYLLYLQESFIVISWLFCIVSHSEQIVDYVDSHRYSDSNIYHKSVCF